ncbi:MAG: SH3 domain-containing protein [Rhodobacterales bacterium]|nr:SH3 domain-containing protein [Rhodobacterales bacterium]
MIRFLALVLWLAPWAAQAEIYPALHDVTGVAADDVLNIRAAPDAGSAIIGSLAPDAQGVEVVGVEGDWAVVNTSETRGYASLRFLARQSGPDWNALQTPLTCIGTEPFWSLHIDPAKGETRFRTPEYDAARTAPITGIWPALPWSQTAAVTLPDGLAVLAPGECSDGMSDQSYGISADLFFTGPARARLSGCCSLDPP